jgi:hypothetical protein
MRAAPEVFGLWRVFHGIPNVQTKGNLVRVRTDIMTGKRIVVIFEGVQLGNSGGVTDISITTWKGGIWQNGEWKEGTKLDEKLSYRGGFRLPGGVDLFYERLYNDYQMDRLTYPVQYLYLPRMGRHAYVEFKFRLTLGAEVGHFLRLYAPPYEPTRRVFMLERVPPKTVDLGSASLDTEPLDIGNEITLMQTGEVRTKLLEPLKPFDSYRVVLSIVVASAYKALTHGKPLQWTLETRDGGELPVNTNDGISREFPIVQEYSFQVSVPRAPPTSEIEVALFINPHYSKPTELVVVAPPTFNFTANCLAEGSGVVIDCQPGPEIADGRATASLTCIDDGFTGDIPDLRIKVQTPKATPMTKVWFVEGVDVWSQAQLGWAEAEGFEVKQMGDTLVTYPSIPMIRARMVWRFRSEVVMDAGGKIVADIPPNLNPECGPYDLEPMALPIVGWCDSSDERKLIILLNSTLVPGEYAFALWVTPPPSTPKPNELSLSLVDQHGHVADAAYNLPGFEIQEKLRLSVLPLSWTLSRAGYSTMITMGFTALESLPDNIVAPKQQITEILLTLPLGFTHLVEKESDFSLVNDDMPLADTDWIDYMEKDKIRITMVLNRTSWITLKAGNYQFRFPAMVPSPMPVFNVWQISLCRPNFGPCSKSTDPAVLVNFAMPGFDLGETSTDVGSAQGVTSDAARGSGSLGFLVAPLIAALALSSRRQ